MNIAIENTEIENQCETMDTLYEELSSAISLASTVLEMNVFEELPDESVGNVYQLVKLIHRCLNKLDEKRQEIDAFINRLSHRCKAPVAGDQLPGELIEALLKVVTLPEASQNFAVKIADHGTALLKHVKNDPSVVNAARVLIDVALERGVNLQIVEYSSSDMRLTSCPPINSKSE